MAKKDVKVTEGTEAVRYTKRQLACSEKYCDRRDLLQALLDDEKKYSVTEADEIMNQFMKGKVKVC